MFRWREIENNATSKYLKTNEKYKNVTIVPRMIAPPDTNLPDTFVVKQSNQLTRQWQPQRNPIRHYRRQTTTNTDNRGTPRAVIEPRALFDRPKSSIVKATTIEEPCPDCINQPALQFREAIYPNRDPESTVCCNPETHIIKTANTNLSKKYSTSNRDYLKRRGLIYRENIWSKQKTNISRDCAICTINTNINTNNILDEVSETGNINNQIGGTDMSAYLYRRSYRDVKNNRITQNGICCDSETVLYKDKNNDCRVQDYPNLSRGQVLCRVR